MSEAATSTTTTEGATAATAGGAATQAAATTQTTTATLLTGTTATGGEATTTQATATDDAAKAAAEAKAKADAEAAAKAGAPEKYEAFTLPEGYTATPEQMTEFGELARDLNLPQASAQKLVDAHVKSVNAMRESMENARIEQETAWRKAAESDKDIGGAALTANLAYAAKALQQFGTPELTKFFTQDTRLGDHPEVLRFFVKVGKALGEDNHIAGGVTAQAKTVGQLLFDKSNHN